MVECIGTFIQGVAGLAEERAGFNFPSALFDDFVRQLGVFGFELVELRFNAIRALALVFFRGVAGEIRHPEDKQRDGSGQGDGLHLALR